MAKLFLTEKEAREAGLLPAKKKFLKSLSKKVLVRVVAGLTLVLAVALVSLVLGLSPRHHGLATGLKLDTQDY